MKEARSLVTDYRDQPGFLTELAGSLATLELDAGNHRQARRLFRLSLVDPNDNALAQAVWANQISPDSATLKGEDLARKGAFEARTNTAFVEGRWTDALTEADAWAADEVFSARPAHLGSYIAAALTRDYETGKLFAHRALEANPRDVLLVNNLVFCEAMMGNLDTAENHMASLPSDPAERTLASTLMATRGLLSYLRNQPETGRVQYRQALDIAERAGLDRARVGIAVHFAERELERRDWQSAGDALSAIEVPRLKKLIAVQTDLKAMVDRVIEHIAAAVAAEISVQ